IKVEGIILDKLKPYPNTGTKSMDYQELKDSIGDITSEFFDTALENMVAQALIQSPDGESYQITGHGINEYEQRKVMGTLF
ncbi:MAG: hypothetical protein M3162_06370, partial [Thermoproteota archaeon]|nr:hypothetical protein [Thermoproteota archaeon]